MAKRQWEYSLTHGPPGMVGAVDYMNKMGNKGWELCSVKGTSEMAFYYWKREKIHEGE